MYMSVLPALKLGIAVHGKQVDVIALETVVNVLEKVIFFGDRKENIHMNNSNELRFYNLEEYRLFQYLMHIEGDIFYEWVRDFMIDPHVEFTAHDMAKDHQAHLEDMFSDNDVLKIGLIKYAFGNCDTGAMHDWMIHEIGSVYKGRERNWTEIFSEPNKNLIMNPDDDNYEKQIKKWRAEDKAEAEALANDSVFNDGKPDFILELKDGEIIDRTENS